MSIAATGRPHLLYVAFAFPPSTASSVYRGLAVPNAFAEAGWDVTVLTIDGEIWSQISGADPELVLSIDPRIKVERISDGGAEDRAKGDLRAFSRLRVNAPFLWRWMLSRRSRRLFPEDYHGLWLPVAAGAARRIHRDHRVDLVMATASPYVSFAVARELPGVPYVLDYRDAWAFHTFSGAPNFPPTSPTARLEARYLEEAEQVWFVNSAIRDEYARLYPRTAGKMRVVPNGFDPQPGHKKPEVVPTDRPTFGYLGTIPHVRTPLRELMAGWAAAFGIDATGNRPAARAIIRGKLSSSGRVGPDLLAVFDEARRHGMEYEGPVSKRHVPEFYRSLDALILLLPAGKYVTGGKTSEYLATGLPIVSVHDLSNATTDLLQDYPLWFPAEELSVQGIAAAFRKCADSLRNPDPEQWTAAWEYGQRFLRSQMLDPVIHELSRRIAPDFAYNSGPAPSALVPTKAGATEGEQARARASAKRQLPDRGPSANPVSVLALITEREGARTVAGDLRARISAATHQEVSLSVVLMDSELDDDIARTVRTARRGLLERGCAGLSTVSGPVGILGRLVQEVTASRRVARAARQDEFFTQSAKAASVVVATDTRGVRAVWQLRGSTNASLVFGPVALAHELKKVLA